LLPANGKVGANENRHPTTPGAFRGTNGSNPASSSSESANHRFLSGGNHRSKVEDIDSVGPGARVDGRHHGEGGKNVRVALNRGARACPFWSAPASALTGRSEGSGVIVGSSLKPKVAGWPVLADVWLDLGNKLGGP
jgi:hypothetical protein